MSITKKTKQNMALPVDKYGIFWYNLVIPEKSAPRKRFSHSIP